jgi:ankyrin repeat protein
MFAAIRGHVDVVNALVAAGADISVADHQGYTAKMLAALEGHAAVVAAFEAAGVDS